MAQHGDNLLKCQEGGRALWSRPPQIHVEAEFKWGQRLYRAAWF